MDLVALAQAPQDGHGGLDGGRLHQHRLEAALQSGVGLEALAVLVERGGAHHAQRSPGQHGLEHVAGVHGPLGAAGAHHGVELVDERDDLAAGLLDFGQHRLQPLLELAPVLGAGHHRGQVQHHETLVGQAVRHIAVDDPLGQSLHDGGLAHAGLADQHRVVLAAPGQDPDHPPDLVITAYNRVQPAGPGLRGEVSAVALQRLVGVLGRLGRHPVAAPHAVQHLEQQLAVEVQIVAQGQHQVLGGQVVVGEVGAHLVGLGEHAVQLAGDADVGPVGAGQGGHRLLGPVQHGLGVDARSVQHGQHQPVGLCEQCDEEVVGRYLGMRGRPGRLGSGREGLRRLERPAIGVQSHRRAALSRRGGGLSPRPHRDQQPARAGRGTASPASSVEWPGAGCRG